MSESIQPIELQELTKRLQELEAKVEKRQKKQAEKEADKQAKAAKKAAAAANMRQFDTPSEPRKSLATFMRNQNKLYVNGINAIDRKAAIMIRVNSTIVSAIVLFFQYIQNLQYGLFIGIVMVLFSFTSLMLAINASRPHMFSILKAFTKKVQNKYSTAEESMFALGANTQITLEAYEAAFEKIVSSQSLQIGNQVRIMYLFEKRQRDSLMHIELSYLSFMVGLTIVVFTFVFGALCDFAT
ncbi:MAG: hypothetical protein AAGJ93_00285 [Bacteroidota bacterium]